MSKAPLSGSRLLEEFRQAMQWQRAGFHAGGSMRRNFTAAESGRLTAGWSTSNTSINGLLENSLPLLWQRSRHWFRNSEFGKRFGSLVSNGIVGPDGITLVMQAGDYAREGGAYVFKPDKLANDAIEAAWKKWCKKGVCEVTGKYSFFDLCRVVANNTARDGELLGRHVRNTRANKYGYQVQMLMCERLHVHERGTRQNGNEVRLGVENDSAGKPQAYYILQRNPNDPLSTGTLYAERVQAKDVLHDFVPLDIEQIRGVPWAHAVLLGANMLHAFEEAAVYAARTGAAHMGFFLQSEENDPAPVSAADLGAKEDEGQLISDAEPGLMQLLPRGVKDFKQFDSKYPTDAFDPFVKSRSRRLAAGLDVSNHALTGDMNEVNYSSARIAELAERDNWKAQQNWFISAFVQPVFENWLQMALLSGQIVMPNGSALPAAKFEKFLEGATFQPRGWDWVDPLKEVQAARMAREEGLLTRTQAVAARGGSFEDNLVQIAAEQKLMEQHKVTLGAPAAPAAEPAKEAVPGKKPAPKQNAQQEDEE